MAEPSQPPKSEMNVNFNQRDKKIFSVNKKHAYEHQSEMNLHWVLQPWPISPLIRPLLNLSSSNSMSLIHSRLSVDKLLSKETPCFFSGGPMPYMGAQPPWPGFLSLSHSLSFEALCAHNSLWCRPLSSNLSDLHILPASKALSYTHWH